MNSLVGLMPSLDFRARDLIWKFLRHVSMHDDMSCLARLAPGVTLTREIMEGFIDELVRSPVLCDSITRYGHLSHDAVTDLSMKLAATSRGSILMLYVLFRFVKPKVVIETGCFTGWFSALMLYAMHRNGKGHLYSIDLPAKGGQFGLKWGLPDGVPPGFLVPQELRQRWTLIIGNVRDELIPLLNKLQHTDIFFHDSDHSYQHMMWEFTSTWPHLRPGGLMISDDISVNTAFWDFSAAIPSPFVIHKSTSNFGAMVKI